MNMKVACIILIALCAVLLIGGTVHAAELEVDYPTVGGVNPNVESDDPFGPIGWAKYLYNVVFALIGVIALVSLIFAGIKWMTSRKEEGIADAKDRITGTVLGLILAGGSFLLLQLINPDLVSLQTPFLEKPRSAADLILGNGGGDDPPPNDPREISCDPAIANSCSHLGENYTCITVAGSGMCVPETGGVEESALVTNIVLTPPDDGVQAEESEQFIISAYVTTPGKYGMFVAWGDEQYSSMEDIEAQTWNNALQARLRIRHAWLSPGNYTIRVRVFDPEGDEKAESFTISVE